jgi:hypothetical protein
MDPNSSSQAVADCPPDLVNAVVDEAALDALWVHVLFELIGLKTTTEDRLPLPEPFLTHLGIAVRILRWEMLGFDFHRHAGFPDGEQVLRDAAEKWNYPESDPKEMYVRLIRLSTERLAWRGRVDLGADIALDDLTDDAALEALAEYLWAQRHAGSKLMSSPVGQ